MALQTTKYWLQAENDRNTHHGDVFIDLIKRAFGVDEVVMVGHHFVFEPKGSMAALDLTHLNEIPSADTLIFDHDIMGEVFGEDAERIMVQCALAKVADRDALVREALDRLPPLEVASSEESAFTIDGDA